MEDLEEGQIILGVVDKIVGTTVFVKIGEDTEGTITTSEIAPGRIRNLRDYVVPGKKIACKILGIRGNNIYLSLRRVKQNEKKELLDKIKKEQNYSAILKTVLGKEESLNIIKKINESQSLTDFFEEVKNNPKALENYLNLEQSKKIITILDSKKDKPKEIKNLIKLSSKDPEGIKKVKEVVNQACKNSKCDISYLAAGKYSLGIIGEDFKEIKSEMNKIIEDLEKLSKKNNCEFEVVKS